MTTIIRMNWSINHEAAVQSVEQQNVRILLYCISAIFLAIAIVCFIFSFIFYKKKSKSENDLVTMFSKAKNWWLKNRGYVFFCLAVLFLLLAIGGFVTVEKIVNSLNGS